MDGNSGIFPLSFVEMEQSELMRLRSEPVPTAEINDRFVIAMFDYLGEVAEDLTFKAGDIIQVVSIKDENWVLGRLSNGKTGYAPLNFCR